MLDAAWVFAGEGRVDLGVLLAAVADEDNAAAWPAGEQAADAGEFVLGRLFEELQERAVFESDGTQMQRAFWEVMPVEKGSERRVQLPGSSGEVVHRVVRVRRKLCEERGHACDRHEGLGEC